MTAANKNDYAHYRRKSDSRGFLADPNLERILASCQVSNLPDSLQPIHRPLPHLLLLSYLLSFVFLLSFLLS